ncbi:MAG: hypothetical protein ACLR2E_04615 [Lachnospiraceae bacterium]
MKEHTYPLKMDQYRCRRVLLSGALGRNPLEKDLQLMKELGLKLPEWESLPEFL